MSMTRKQIIILGALVFFFILVAGIGFLRKNNNPANSFSGSPTAPASVQKLFPRNATGTAAAYSNEVPVGALPTKPASEVPAAANTQAQLGIFDMTVGASGYSPATLTVRQGNLVQIKLTATDGNYDFSLPYLGIYASVNKGETKNISFGATTSGSYIFECRDFCPSGSKIQGALIVLPNK